MPSIAAIVIGGFTAVYFFLRLILYLTQDAREPPAILTSVPFLSPLVAELVLTPIPSANPIFNRDTFRLPIYTLRLPFSRIYIVNATELIPGLQKQWRSVSFAALAAGAGNGVGLSKEGNELLCRDLTSKDGFSHSWPKYIMPAMSPGKDLDLINRKSIEIFAGEMDKIRANGVPIKTGLWSWAREIMIKSTSEAVWGPQNPYSNAAVAQAWKTFERGFLTISTFPMASVFFPKLYKARELAVAAMNDYIRKGGHKTASGLVRRRYEHHVEQWGLSLDDFARGELANTFAVLGNSTPCALWVLFQIFSDETVLADVRNELSAIVKVREEDGVNCIDLATIRTSCPILLSTFQETLRFRAVNTGPRVVLEDVFLNDHILLKRGSMLMVPANVQHTDTSAWGYSASQFDHMRFVEKPGQKRPNRVAFRAFGGGHELCPGRHFASTEIMALAALLALQFDVVPTNDEGRWIEPTCKSSPVQVGFPIPDKDIDVEIRPRDASKKWEVTFSGSEEAAGIVSEDIDPSAE